MKEGQYTFFMPPFFDGGVSYERAQTETIETEPANTGKLKEPDGGIQSEAILPKRWSGIIRLDRGKIPKPTEQT